MEKYKIAYSRRYSYSAEVFLEPHTLRLMPRRDHYQQVQEFKHEVLPAPTRQYRTMGLGNNEEWLLRFDSPCRQLEIKTETIVSTHETDRFAWEIYPFTATRLPMVYDAAHLEKLAPFLKPLARNDDFLTMSKELLLEANYMTLHFAILTAKRLKQWFKLLPEGRGEAISPEQVLQLKAGDHRELGQLYVALCRQAGIAARFVSGYLFRPETPPTGMHTWAEVYLPGAGWVGFDPTTGQAVGQEHIAVATAGALALCAPISGLYRGQADCNVRVQLQMERL